MIPDAIRYTAHNILENPRGQTGELRDTSVSGPGQAA